MGALTRLVYDPRLTGLAELGYLPDGLLRWGIRRGLAERSAGLEAGGPDAMRRRERESRPA